MTHTMIVGTSEPQDFEIQEDGVALPSDGFTLDIEWRGAAPTNPPTLNWLDQDAGRVRFTDVSGMAIGTYRFRFTLTDTGGKKGYVPNLRKQANTWIVESV